MFFDTHAHLDDKQFDLDREELIASFPEVGVTRVLNAACDLASSREIVNLTRKYRGIFGSVGVHPNAAEELKGDAELDLLRTLSKEKKICAIGEIGLDYYWDDVPREVQKTAFRMQLDLARELSLPVIIHDRDAHEDCLNILRDYTDLSVVFHCYSGSLEFAKILIDLGFYLSFTGVITFKNAKAAPSVVEWAPHDRIMIETDCPYLAPIPYRGKRNHSGYVPLVAQKIAELWGTSVEEVARITTENGLRFFQITSDETL
ncbi:MAG: TatD family hydrolase [Oscillospiraceae bacterium]|nr:TatD family hydrolase [Oscillospiraceae bacterium]